MTTEINNYAEICAEPSVELTAEETRKAVMRERLLKGREKMRELRASGMKSVRLNPVEKAQANPNSLKRAITANCWVCVGADADPGARFRVRDCGIIACPLHPHRPWQNVTGRLSYNEDGSAVAPIEADDAEDGADNE